MIDPAEVQRLGHLRTPRQIRLLPQTQPPGSHHAANLAPNLARNLVVDD